MKTNNTPATMNANETTYKVTITNEDYTDTKHNTILTGFASVEAASKAAKEAARDIAGELTNVKVIYSETINAFVVVNPNSGAWLVIAKVEEDSTPTQPTAKRITVKRSEWNETAKRLECSGWYYIGTPTATGKTIYRRGNSEAEIIIEEDTPAPEFSELSHAETIARRIEAMKPRGAWNNGVKQYALMLLDWYETEANGSSLTLETMLNGAKDWKQYARGGAGVAQCYNARIAETLCSPSELKRNNHGAKMPNRFEDWQDVEARALFQAWQLINEAKTLVNYNA